MRAVDIPSRVRRPVGIPVEVTRRRDGEDMNWSYRGFAARLRRRTT